MQHRAADNRPAGEKRNLVIIRPKGELGKSLLRDPKPKPSQLELPKIVHRSTDQRKSLLKPVEPSQDFKTCSIDDQQDNLEELRAAITKLEYQIDQIEDQLSGKRLVNIGMAKNIEKLIVEGSKVQRDLENTIHDNENTRSEISTKNGVVEANKRKLELKKQELEAVGRPSFPPENSNREARQVSLRADQMESEMHTYRRTIQSQIMMSNAIMPLLLSAVNLS